MKLRILITLIFVLGCSVYGQTSQPTPNPSPNPFQNLEIIIQPFTPPPVAKTENIFNNALIWGKEVDGLQIAVSVGTRQTSGGSQLQIAFQNAGDKDLTLNLGKMLANGKVQLPENISLAVVGEDGKTHRFRFFDGKYASVAGRVDDYVVPLRSGSIYVIKLRFDQFYCSETSEFLSNLPAGNHRMTAQFEGSAAKAVNLDMPGIRLMNFWLGTVQSNSLIIRGGAAKRPDQINLSERADAVPAANSNIKTYFRDETDKCYYISGVARVYIDRKNCEEFTLKKN